MAFSPQAQLEIPFILISWNIYTIQECEEWNFYTTLVKFPASSINFI
jgi:hypothetical protein